MIFQDFDFSRLCFFKILIIQYYDFQDYDFQDFVPDPSNLSKKIEDIEQPKNDIKDLQRGP